MDKRNLTSGSGSDYVSVSNMRKKPNPDDFEDDSSMDEFEDESEEEDEVMIEEEEDLRSTEEKEKEAYNNLALMFMDSSDNPNIIKTPSFSKFIHLVKPDLPLDVPSVEKEILEIYEERKEKVKKFLKDFQGKLTLSYEWLLLGWQDHIKTPILHEDFVVMTAHFVDDNWKVRKLVLGYTTDEKTTLGDIYPYHFRTVVNGFEIDNKVATILIPNEQDFDTQAIVGIRKCIEEKGNSSITPPVFVIYCCADMFRLMVEDLASAFKWGFLEDVRMLVGWGRLSSTNWNVTLFHLQQAVDLKAEDAFSSDEYNGYDKPSDEEWIQLQTYCKLAGCIYKVSKVLYEGGYSTSNVYFHLLAELKGMLKQEVVNAEGNNYFVRKAETILKRFDKYWNDMFLVLATASVLDPRFKLKYLDFYCVKNDEGQKAETVLDYLRSLYAKEISKEPITPVCVIDSDEEEDDYYTEEEKIQVEERKEKEKSKTVALYEEFVLFQEFLKYEGSSLREFGESELDAYLKEPVVEWNKELNVLEWWKGESEKYPVLSRVARDVLAIPISLAESFDAYAPDKREPPELVLGMDPKVSNAMMCGKSWMRV